MESNPLILLYAAIIGLSIGTMSGLSISPVISEVIIALLGLITVLTPYYLKLKGSNEKSEKIAPYLLFLATLSIAVLAGSWIGLNCRVERNFVLEDRRIQKDIEHRKQYIEAQVELNRKYPSFYMDSIIELEEDSILGIRVQNFSVPQIFDVAPYQSEALDKGIAWTLYSDKQKSKPNHPCSKINNLLADSMFFSVPADQLEEVLRSQHEFYPILPYISELATDSTELRTLLKSLSKCFCK